MRSRIHVLASQKHVFGPAKDVRERGIDPLGPQAFADAHDVQRHAEELLVVALALILNRDWTAHGKDAEVCDVPGS